MGNVGELPPDSRSPVSCSLDERVREEEHLGCGLLDTSPALCCGLEPSRYRDVLNTNKRVCICLSPL